MDFVHLEKHQTSDGAWERPFLHHRYQQGKRRYIQIPAVVRYNPKGPLISRGIINKIEAEDLVAKKEGV